MDIGLAAKLQQAIKSNQLAMYHQPQINVRTNQVIGSEVLLRWPTPEHQHINIEELILLAERTGLINELTLWVIEQACQDIVELNKHGFNEHTVSVNLSAKNLSINKLAEKIENALLTHNIPAKQLKFELTESALVENQQQMTSFMEQLQKLGVHVILDDFGTGYSSLNYLVNYTFSNLKIDKSFVLDLTTNQSHQVIVKTAIDMAHNLGLSVTVEGVEDKGTHQLLIEMGADNTQGYYYSKAIPITDYLQWLRAC